MFDQFLSYTLYLILIVIFLQIYQQQETFYASQREEGTLIRAVPFSLIYVLSQIFRTMVFNMILKIKT